MSDPTNDQTTAQPDPSVPPEAASEPPPKSAERQKDPAAVSLGRRGGLKGGKARVSKMTKEQLSESARNAANTRWRKTKPRVDTRSILAFRTDWLDRDATGSGLQAFLPGEQTNANQPRPSMSF